MRYQILISASIIILLFIFLFYQVRPHYDTGQRVSYSEKFGGKGGHTNFDFICPNGSYITEIGGLASSSEINGIGVSCSNGTTSSLFTQNTLNNNVKVVPSHSGSPWSTYCPEGFKYIMGFTKDMDNVTDIKGLSIFCDPEQLGKKYGTHVVKEFVGSNDGTRWNYKCPGGKLIGINGSYDDVAINTLQFTCGNTS